MLDDEWSQFLSGGILTPIAATATMTLVPTPSPLYISTTTKIAYLNQAIDLNRLFFQLKIIGYSESRIGILKKVMKFTCTSQEEIDVLNERTQEAHTEIISSNISGSRMKFKDVRKISVGMSSKDILMKSKKKSAFYNCLVIILRVRIPSSTFKEYHIKIFNTGKLEIPGIQNSDEFQIVVQTFLQVIDYDNLTIIPAVTDTVLINSNFNCGFYIKRDLFYEILKHEYGMQCVYDPCSYPGIQCKFFYDIKKEIQTGVQDYDDIKGKGYGYCKGGGGSKPKSKLFLKKNGKYSELSIMIFRTGSILIVGMCSEDTLSKVYDVFRQILLTEFPRIVQETTRQMNTTTSTTRKKKMVSINVKQPEAEEKQQQQLPAIGL
jgi:TATA-box binding protein (TBP) (component of TFIID and TFIIIB)